VRWSRRKAVLREGRVEPEPSAPAAETALPESATIVAPPPPPAESDKPPPPTLDDVAALGRTSDYRRFVAPGVGPEVKNAALKKLFTDPQFNVMDGLDTYIDDYGKPDPIPASMLRQMVQSRALGLFADEDETPDAAPAARATPDGAPGAQAPQSAPELPNALADDQDAAVRLQPLDAAGPDRDPGGIGQDAGRER
jgi:Protein of unknown function (DUF3306)